MTLRKLASDDDYGVCLRLIRMTVLAYVVIYVYPRRWSEDGVGATTLPQVTAVGRYAPTRGIPNAADYHTIPYPITPKGGIIFYELHVEFCND